MTNKSKEITYFSLFLQVLFGCIYPDMCIAYSFGFVWLHFSGHVHCIHFGFVFFGSLYIYKSYKAPLSGSSSKHDKILGPLI